MREIPEEKTATNRFLSDFRYRNFPFACLLLGASSTLEIISTYQEPSGLSL